MICIGCGGEATGELGFSEVPACRPCWESFMAAFDKTPTPAGIVLPESPATRIADAVLRFLGQPPAS